MVKFLNEDSVASFCSLTSDVTKLIVRRFYKWYFTFFQKVLFKSRKNFDALSGIEIDIVFYPWILIEREDAVNLNDIKNK